MVHVMLRAIHAHGNPHTLKPVDIRTGIHGLVIIADHPHLHIAPMGALHGIYNPVVRDGKHTHIYRGASRAKHFRDLAHAIVIRTKV